MPQQNLQRSDLAMGIEHGFPADAAPRGIAVPSPRQFYWLLVAIVAAALLYLPTTASLARLWNAFGSRFYTHGDLILGMAIIALARRREVLSRVRATPSWLGIGLLLPLTLAWLVLYQSTVQIAHQALLPVILLDVVYAFFGLGIARLCLYPLASLYFAIPVWEWLVPPLQRLTVAAMEVVLPLTGVPTLIVGDMVHVPAGSFEIEGGCAGEMYLIMALAMGAFYGDLLRASSRARLVLMVVAGGLAILGNWLRVFGVIIAGQLTDMQSYLVRVSHDEFGWAVFGIAMVAFVLLANRFVISQQDLSVPHIGDPVTPRSRAAAVVVASALACTGPCWHALLSDRGAATAQIDRPADTSGDWSGPLTYEGAWRPKFVGADQESFARYRNARGQETVVYDALYRRQSQEVKLHRTGNSLLSDDLVQVGDVSPVANTPFRELQYQTKAGEAGIVWATYRVADRTTSSPTRAQLWYSVYSLAHPAAIGVTALQTACQPDCVAARQLLQSFAAAHSWIMAAGSRGDSTGIRP
jgi:EpsI family protein